MRLNKRANVAVRHAGTGAFVAVFAPAELCARQALRRGPGRAHALAAEAVASLLRALLPGEHEATRALMREALPAERGTRFNLPGSSVARAVVGALRTLRNELRRLPPGERSRD